MFFALSTVVAYATLTAAGAVHRTPRAVQSLNEAATAEAHERDNGATRAFSNVQIKTSDGRCLFVDKLSGDFRANLTPIQVAACGSTDGQGWDVITAGKHNNAANSALIVSTLTQACFNFDPRRAAGNQALLFSCGGRADGGGEVTPSQLFAFNGGAGPLSFEPENAKGSCFTVKGNTIDIAQCRAGDESQSFTLGGAPAGGNGGGNAQPPSPSSSTRAAGSGKGRGSITASGGKKKGGKTNATKAPATSASTSTPAQQTDVSSSSSSPSAGPSGGSGNGDNNNNNSGGGATAKVTAIPNPTVAVPVSRAGGTLQPTAAAESHQKDETATRAFTGVEIRAPNGQCLFVDPTAGDFRQNLIPVSLVDCSGTPNEKWDVITAGKHNNAKNAAIIVSSLTNGCITTDSRRAADDNVTIFSCGGRADGNGETNTGQTFPFIGEQSFPLSSTSENGKTCVVPGNGRLELGPCPTDGGQLFSIFP